MNPKQHQRQDEWREMLARLDPIEFGRKVNTIRVGQKQPLENVARKIGERTEVLRKIETGEILVTRLQILRLARSLNTKPTRLVEP